eukprot:1160682-Pelagomonas_calceolata.AAC.5
MCGVGLSSDVGGCGELPYCEGVLELCGHDASAGWMLSVVGYGGCKVGLVSCTGSGKGSSWGVRAWQ